MPSDNDAPGAQRDLQSTDETPGAIEKSAESLAILLTAPQPAAIAVIRLDGPATAPFITQHLSRPLQIGRCVHCDLRDGDNVIDDPVAVLTGSDRVDLNVHGGPWVIEATLRLAAASGFRIVHWQDAPVVAADAASDLDAELAAALPFAVTRQALTILLAQPAAWRTMLAQHDRGEMRSALNDRAQVDRALINRALADRTVERILRPPTVAITGLPNAGKSTLLNYLAGQARSIVADLAGTTRDYVTTPALFNGLLVKLIDTPGRRDTADPIEAAAIARAAAIIQRADVIIDLGDAAQRPTEMPADRPAESHHSPPPNTIIVWNKTDRAPAPAAGLAISAVTGAGIPALIEAVLQILHVDDLASLHARCWTDRQRKILSRLLQND